MNDPRGIKFCNEGVRVASEAILAVAGTCANLKASWDNPSDPVSALFQNDAGDLVEDGRQKDGESQLTGADVHEFISAVDTILAIQAKVSVLRKASVRFD